MGKKNRMPLHSVPTTSYKGKLDPIEKLIKDQLPLAKLYMRPLYRIWIEERSYAHARRMSIITTLDETCDTTNAPLQPEEQKQPNPQITDLP